MDKRLTRVREYRHLEAPDLQPPGRSNVFFDPADTEVGIWATVDLVTPGCTVLDLGSGSGAAAAAVRRAGAGSVYGLDISEPSVAWACEHHREDGHVSFGLGDYSQLSTEQLLRQAGFPEPPDIVTSNPPYVPVPPPPAGEGRVSIDGGTDGLRWVRLVLRHAEAMGSALGLTIGSYTTPRLAVSLLRECGYGISSLTLGALRLGEYTRNNPERVLELERTGEGPLLRVDGGVPYYIMAGLSCRRLSDETAWHEASPLSPDGFLDLLVAASRSGSVELEGLDELEGDPPVDIRVLVLPDEPDRLHC